MIEVEKKFILTKDDEARLTQGAEFLKEYSFTDAYYDTGDYALTSQDVWLRARDGKWELKIPLHKGAERLGDQYRELTDENEIKKYLQISQEKTFEDALKRKGYVPFSTFTRVRRKYRKESFIIDLDFVDFGDFIYTIGEIELMIKDQDDMKAALDKIMDFARKHDLKITHVRGKLMEYLKRKRPEHHKALIKANVAKDF